MTAAPSSRVDEIVRKLSLRQRQRPVLFKNRSFGSHREKEK
jgi:hypothetical protein